MVDIFLPDILIFGLSRLYGESNFFCSISNIIAGIEGLYLVVTLVDVAHNEPK